MGLDVRNLPRMPVRVVFVLVMIFHLHSSFAYSNRLLRLVRYDKRMGYRLPPNFHQLRNHKRSGLDDMHEFWNDKPSGQDDIDEDYGISIMF